MLDGLRNKVSKATICNTAAITIMFLFMIIFYGIYTVLYGGLRTMLSNKENSLIRSNASLVEEILNSSNNYLFSAIKDWAIWERTYGFMLGDYDEYLEYFMESFSYEYDLDFITLLDLKGNVVYERFFQRESNMERNNHLNLREMYTKIGASVPATYTPPHDMPHKNIKGQMGMSGFIKINDRFMFISSYPVLHDDKTGPCVGSMLFGKVIDINEFKFMGNNSSISMSMYNKDEISLNEESEHVLEEQNILIMDENGKILTLYKVFRDFFGEKSLLLSISAPRYLYREVKEFAIIILSVTAVCSVLSLWIIIKSVGFIVVNAWSSLICNDGIEFEQTNQPKEAGNENVLFRCQRSQRRKGIGYE